MKNWRALTRWSQVSRFNRPVLEAVSLAHGPAVTALTTHGPAEEMAVKVRVLVVPADSFRRPNQSRALSRLVPRRGLTRWRGSRKANPSETSVWGDRAGRGGGGGRRG